MLDLFSSVKLGIVLLVVLLAYSWIGSAGLFYPTSWHIFDSSVWTSTFPRQWRGLEMTEFEWFKTPFFNALIALICLNIAVTTIRRITFGWVNLGVWMIHAGILVLCAGSVVYFGCKVEGDAPVVRREVVIQFPGAAHPLVLPALLGAHADVEIPSSDPAAAPRTYSFQVADINPRWPIQSEENKGRTSFSVSVGATTPERQFIRQLLDGYPQYTEDVIPGRGRAKKLAEFNGKAITDDSFSMTLAPVFQDRFWIKDSAAIALRPHTDSGSGEWTQRPIASIPRYNDYIADGGQVWGSGEPDADESTHLLSINVPTAEAADPAPDLKVRITGYLRYAVMQSDYVAGGATLNPVAEVTFENPQASASQRMQLAALDPAHGSAFNGMVAFRWVSDAQQLDTLRASATRKLMLTVPGRTEPFDAPIDPGAFGKPDAPWVPIPGTSYAYRVQGQVDNMAMPGAQGADARTVWFLIVQIKTPTRVITRYVADDPANTRDTVESPGGSSSAGHDMTAPDAEVTATYQPAMLAPVTLVAGPGSLGVRVLLNISGEPAREETIAPGQTVAVRPGGVLSMRLDSYLPAAREEERPLVVPVSQRDKDADRALDFAMARVELTQNGRTTARWLPMQRYCFDDDETQAHLSPLPAQSGNDSPNTITLDDGRRVDIMLTRQWRKLPSPVMLDDFIVTSNVGGFEPGKTGSIRDWTSVLRFGRAHAHADLEDPVTISTNSPVENSGYWYFQSFWDAPRGPRFQGDPPSSGLAYTGLGVGNREGVHTQLAGCCIAVFGMIYAFYVKPIIKRRRRERVLRSLGASAPARNAAISNHLADGVLVGAGADGAEARP